MKSLVAITLAATLTVACSRSEPQQTADPQPQPPAAQPPPAAPAVTPAPPPAETASQPAATTPRPAAPEKPATPAPTTSSTPAAPPAVAAAPPAPAPKPVEPPPPPPPAFREVTVPAGTSLAVSVLSNLASNTSQVEDRVRGSIAKAVVIDGVTAVPTGSEIIGAVSEVKESGRVKGKASIGFRFDRMVVRGDTHQIQTAAVMQEAQDKKSDDVKKGGIGAGLGAVVGGIAGGGTGAAIGAVAGGTGAVLGTKGREVEIPAGTVVNVLLQTPLTLQVPVKQQPQ
jgi:hypothetical protein